MGFGVAPSCFLTWLTTAATREFAAAGATTLRGPSGLMWGDVGFRYSTFIARGLTALQHAEDLTGVGSEGASPLLGREGETGGMHGYILPHR